MKEDLAQGRGDTESAEKNFWNINSVLLRERYSGFYEQLKSVKKDFPYEIKIETAASGDPTMSINGMHIHSPRDPAREGQRLAQAAAQSVNADNAPVVILGFGLGYAAQAAAQYAAQSAVLSAAKNNRPVIIAEKHLYLLRKAFETRDLTDLLSFENIIFAAGGSGDDILSALNIAYDLIKYDEAEASEDKPAPAVIKNRALIDLDNEWYKNIEEKIRTFSMKDKVNTATQKRFGKRWVRNIARNMNAIRDVPGINLLTQRRRTEGSCDAANNFNFPVFLAAAGPSLDKIKPYLKDIYDRCIIIAVDTNLRFFTNNGIHPDFVLTVDPQFWNSRHLDCCYQNNIINEKTALIIESAVYPSILQLPYKRKFIMGSLFPLSLFIEKQVDVKGRLGAGGSVATTAWDFALRLTENREIKTDIWIAGLDLAYPDYKTHFRGARFEEIANCESCRLNPAETWVSRALRDGVPFKRKSGTGGTVLTDSRLSLYAAWFENQFSQHKNIRNLSLFREGLAINGLQAACIEDLLTLPVCRKEIDIALDNCYAQIDTEFYGEEETRKRGKRYENAVESLTRGLNSIKKTAEEGIKIIQSYKTGSDQAKITKELDRIMRKIQDSEVKEIVSFLIPIEDGKRGESAAGKQSEASDNPFVIYLQSSLKLFNSLSESAEFYLGCLG